MTSRSSRPEGLWKVILVAVGIAAPMLAVGTSMVYGDWERLRSAREEYWSRRESLNRVLGSPALPPLEVAAAARGRDVFASTCVACHGMEGHGVLGLGKDLSQSWFVASLDDGALRTFLMRGRDVGDPENTTRVAMPARGGREDLKETDMADVATYLRGLQDPRRMPSLPAATAPTIGAPTADDKAKALAAAGGDAELAEFIAHGQQVYRATCIACHGGDAHGLKGLGKDLIVSDFVRKTDDDGMLAFLKRGRSAGDPANTTKVDMPPRGGNPALSDDDLLDVVAFVRSLQVASSSSK